MQVPTLAINTLPCDYKKNSMLFMDWDDTGSKLHKLELEDVGVD